MSRKHQNVGRQTFELAEIAPLPLWRGILDYRDDGQDALPTIDWPSEQDQDEDVVRQLVLDRLNLCSAEVLRAIEDRCIRIGQLATGKGPASLTHVAEQRLSHEELEKLDSEMDDLGRSAWIFLHRTKDFQDAEAFHGARQYRDHGKMYDVFEVEPGRRPVRQALEIDAEKLASLVTERLGLPGKVEIRTLDLSPTETHPASVLVIVRHAGPLSSVLSVRANGVRAPIYFRPPNEATLIWTPADQKVEICGPSPEVRRGVAETFAEAVFGTDLSKKPLKWRHYDLSRFHESFRLTLPVWDDIDVTAAKLVAVEMRLGSWSRRLSLKVTIDDDIEKVAKVYLGGSLFLKRVEGFSRLSIAVKFKLPGSGRERSMEISFGDRQSNLQGKPDSLQRDLGYRLLEHWGILNRLRPLEYDEIVEILPSLLALHDLPKDEISGGHLRRLGLVPKRLLDAGVIGHIGRQSMVLLDEGEEEVLIETGPREGEVTATTGFGEAAGSLDVDDVRRFELKRDWLEEILLNALRPLIGKGPVQHLGDDLAFMGNLRADGAAVPIYLARRLDQLESLQKTDVILRGRQDGGIGIVLAACTTPLTHLGPNVVVILTDILSDGKLDGEVSERMLERLKVGRWLALGGSEVALLKFGQQTAMLYIPGKVPLAVGGAKQIKVLERLVDAHKAGGPGVRTGALVEGTGVRSPADAWPSEVRHTVVGTYFESAGRGFWRLKID